MSVSKMLRFMMLLFLLVASFIWIEKSYSAQTISYELAPIKSADPIEQVYKSFENATFNWEMKTPDYTLVMTTGNDQMHKKLTGLQTPWSSLSGQEAVLSESVASRLLKTSASNKQTLKIHDQTFLVSNVIREGDYLFIPFNEKLLTQNWQRVRFFYTAENLQSAELTDERLFNLMTLSGFEVLNKNFSKNPIYFFYNLALLLCLYALLLFVRLLYNSFNQTRLTLLEKRQALKPFYGFKTFAKAEKKALIRCFLKLLGLVLLGFTLVKFLDNMILPKVLIPSNWFSLSSYYDIYQLLANNWNYQLQFGFTGVMQMCLRLVSLIVLYVVLIDQWLLKKVVFDTSK